MRSIKGRLKRNDKAAWQVVEDKVVVVTPQTRKIHILYGSASLVWQSLQEPNDFAGILTRICDEYEVDCGKAKIDLEVFLLDLLQKRVIAEVK